MTIAYEYRCPACLNALPAELPEKCSNCGASTTVNSEESKSVFADKIKTHFTKLDADQPGWGAGWGLLLWFLSIVLMFGGSILAAAAWTFKQFVQTGKVPTTQPHLDKNPDLVIILLLATFVAQVLTIGLAYILVMVKSNGKFLEALGWHWHPKFRLLHAILTTIGIFILLIIITKFLPQSETDLEKLLNSSIQARLITAFLAVVMAPIVEEVIYRGVLFAGLRKSLGPVTAVLGVSFVFMLVHVPQYSGSVAAITAIGTLSLILTVVRAYTGSLLPCFVIHLLFNGIQAIGIVLSAFANNK